MEEHMNFKLVYVREKEDEELKLNDFEVLNLIGKGSISNVYLIKKKSTEQAFAMKCI
jgi:hypothetical protein